MFGSLFLLVLLAFVAIHEIHATVAVFPVNECSAASAGGPAFSIAYYMAIMNCNANSVMINVTWTNSANTVINTNSWNSAPGYNTLTGGSPILAGALEGSEPYTVSVRTAGVSGVQTASWNGCYSAATSCSPAGVTNCWSGSGTFAPAPSCSGRK
jgi:hypothetical protein